MISVENQYILDLLAAVLHDRSRACSSAVEWEKVYSDLKTQSVAILPGIISEELKLQSREEELYLQDVGKSIRNFFNILEEQEQLIGVLREKGIPVAVLKGTAAAMYYRHPEYRSMGDIDLIVPVEDYERARDVLSNHGYRLEIDLDIGERHAVLFTESEIEIELHHHFSSSHDKAANEALDRWITKGLQDVEWIELEGYRFPALPTMVNGLVLLSHINQHIGTGLGLRQIIDWMCFVEHFLDDERWNAEFSVMAQEIGLERLAIVVTALCRRYLGLESELTWCDEVLENELDIVDELIEYIFAHGNFGRNDSIGTKTVSVIRSFRNPIQGLKAAQKAGLANYPICQRIVLLRGFAWLFQVVLWIRKGLRLGIRITDMEDYRKKERRETDFLERLGINRL